MAGAPGIAPGEVCEPGSCALGTCGGLYDYNGPCGGCCSCLGGCLNDGPAEPVCACPYRPIGHGLSARIPDPECPVEGHGVETAELDVAREREG